MDNRWERWSAQGDSCKDFPKDKKIRIGPDGKVYVGRSNSDLKMQSLMVLKYLLGRRGKLTTFKQIIDGSFRIERQTPATEPNVRVHISIIRKRLKDLGADFSLETIKGEGYIFTFGKEENK